MAWSCHGAREDGCRTQRLPHPRRSSQMVKPLMIVVAAALVLAGCQRDDPAPQARTRSGPPEASYASPGGAPVDVDPTHVDVQVTRPLRQDVIYTINLPANISPWYQTTLY